MTEVTLPEQTEETATKATPELSDAEKQKMLEQFSHLDANTLKSTLEAIAMMIRAFEGKSVEPDDVITRLINVKNNMERSNFPTMLILQEQVYCRLVAKYHPELEAFSDYADEKAHALIALKGQNWFYYGEFLKASNGSGNVEQTIFDFNNRTQPKQGRFHLPGRGNKQQEQNLAPGEKPQ
jgi:hypothetical protein